MIQFTRGNLLEADADAIVNAVNTVGVMGKGIALQFKLAYPHNFKQYKSQCDAKALKPGILFVVRDNHAPTGDKIIINFPTKAHWKVPPKLST
ncbi:MAG: macro domain-containing protein [Chitinophagaceae bacterium]|nr:macro domain-containing protein [Chitinophagaceae bacterium]